MKVETMINGAKKKADEKKRIEQERVLNVLKRSFTHVANSPDGIIVLRHIMEQSGWDTDLIVGDPTTGDIHDRGTLFNVARRSLYKHMRNLIPVRALKRIEYEKTIYKGEDEYDL